MVLNSSFWPDLSIKSRCYWSSILSVNVFPFHAFNTFTVCTRGGWNSAIWGNYLLSTLILIKAKSKSVAFRTILKVASLILLKLFKKKMSGQFFICDVRLQKKLLYYYKEVKTLIKDIMQPSYNTIRSRLMDRRSRSKHCQSPHHGG